MKHDRTELNYLAGSEPEVLGRMAKMYEDWAERPSELTWPVIPDQTALPRFETTRIHDFR